MGINTKQNALKKHYLQGRLFTIAALVNAFMSAAMVIAILVNALHINHKPSFRSI